jgi:hypothetical protein
MADNKYIDEMREYVNNLIKGIMLQKQRLFPKKKVKSSELTALGKRGSVLGDPEKEKQFEKGYYSRVQKWK